MKVILTNKQFDIIAEALRARFTVSEVRITFLNKRIDENFGGPTMPPHKKLAINLAGNKIHKYPFASRFDFNDKENPNNPFNKVPCVGVSYYFKASFNVDGRQVRGVIRVSDHPVTPATFAKRGYDYGLSIVFDNGSTRVGGHNSIDATVYEYVTSSIGPDVANKLYHITTEFIRAAGDITIENDKVISPSGIDFKKITKHSDKTETKHIILATSADTKTTRFMSASGDIVITATKNKFDDYEPSQDDLSKFGYGDKITFYKIDKGTPVKLGRSYIVDK